jgi:hypothetical protein
MNYWPNSASVTYSQDMLLPSAAHLPDINNKIHAAEKADQDRQKAK